MKPGFATLKHRTLAPIALLLAAALPLAPVAAQNEAEARQIVARIQAAVQSFQKLDEDYNGKLAREDLRYFAEEEDNEAAAKLLEAFDARDRNGDGVLDFREYLGDDAILTRAFALADRNSDGGVSKAELYAWLQIFENPPKRADVEQRFSFADRNGDGQVSRSEFDAAMANP